MSLKMSDTLFFIGVIYLLLSPVLFQQVDPALCWYAGKGAISDLSPAKRVVGRGLLRVIVLAPTMAWGALLRKK